MWNKQLIPCTIFCIGVFSLLVQALLFRDFLSVFDGSEISTGLFLFAWLLWICIGALIAWLPPASKHARRCFAYLLLFYPFAFILEKYLLLNTRQLLSVAEYELIPLGKLAIAAVFFAAPVSLITGALFVSAVKWVEHGPVPVAKVYVIEALGSFCGALAVTLMLASGIADETIFLLATAVTSGALSLNCFRTEEKSGRCRTMPYLAALAIAITALLSAIFGFGSFWQRLENQKQWSRMLPGGKYAGSFYTPQAKYLCGDYSGSFIVLCWNSVYENLADRESALQCAALNLAQQPAAERILIIGPGTFNLSRTFCEIKGIRQVVWLDTDPDYAKTLPLLLPKQFQAIPAQMKIPGIEIKDYLRTANDKFDLAILRFPAPSSLSLSRYFSKEFYQLVSRVMTESGVVSASFQGGENYLSPEISFLGGLLLLNLRQVFSSVALMPGENSCFWAAFKAGKVSDSAPLLQKRLNEISYFSKIFPPQYLETVFDPLRVDLQMTKYLETASRLRQQNLSSSDSNPLACLFTMIFSIKKLGGAQLPAAAITFYSRDILPLCIIALALYVMARIILRCFVRRKQLHPAAPSHLEGDIAASGFDVLFILFFISIIAMALNIWLMFAFQMDKGSIFLYFGLVSAFFMLGLFCGGRLTDFLQNRGQGRYCSFVSASSGFIVFLLLLRHLPCGSLPVWIFALLFLGAGFFGGIYLPRAAYIFKQRGHGDTASAALLETLDNIGGAIGGIITAVILLPLLGTDKLLLLAIAAMLMLLVVAHRKPGKKL
jgi:spermidine synthase